MTFILSHSITYALAIVACSPRSERGWTLKDWGSEMSIEQIMQFLSDNTPGAAYEWLLGLVLAGIVAGAYEWFAVRPFRGWRIKVIQPDGEVGTDRELSFRKARAILEEPSDMSVFVKGVASTYGWLNVDPLTKGRDLGVFRIEGRTIVVDLTKNPKSSPPPKAPSKAEIAEEVVALLIARGLVFQRPAESGNDTAASKSS